jgi:tripartite-type tricarboxylate transporter receptor subunit TctC
MSIRSKLAVLALVALTAMGAAAQTASWPTRPVRWIVPWAPGGSSDGLGRFLALKLADRWGQQVVVDNRPGGNTIIGAVEAAKSAADGYTLFQPLNATLTMNPFAVSKLPYDPQKDFTLIGIVAYVPLIFVSNDTLPAKTLQEVVSYARTRPDVVTIGYAGAASQIAAEQFARDWGLKLRMVPYKSGVDITRALLSGDIQMAVDGVTQYPQHLKSGKLRGLATTGSKRIAALGNVPALVDIGMKKSDTPIWQGIVGPAGLPDAVRQRVAQDLQQLLGVQEVRDHLVELGFEPTWMGPEDFAKLIRTESAMMGRLVKEYGIRMD